MTYVSSTTTVGAKTTGMAVGTGFSAIVRTEPRYAALIARLILAMVMFPHGAQKLLGSFGGSGFSSSLEHLVEDYGVWPVFAFLTILVEFFGPLALAIGFLTRIAALGIGAVMVGAAVLVHLPYGFFMNWFGKAGGEGFEYHILVLGLVAVLLIEGGGLLSVDRFLTSRLVRTDASLPQDRQADLVDTG